LESAVSRAAVIPRVDELDGVVERGGRSCGGDMELSRSGKGGVLIGDGLT